MVTKKIVSIFSLLIFLFSTVSILGMRPSNKSKRRCPKSMPTSYRLGFRTQNMNNIPTNNPETERKLLEQYKKLAQSEKRRTTDNQPNPRSNNHDPFVKKLADKKVLTNYKQLLNGDYLLQVRSVRQGDIGGSLGGGICPAMSLRNVELMLNCFLNDENPTYLERMNSMENAKSFLNELSSQNIKHKDLHSSEIETILSRDRLSILDNYNKTLLINANANNVTVIDSLEHLSTGKYYDLLSRQDDKLANLTLNIQNAKNEFYHGFIIGTNPNGGGHWISGAVYKNNGTKYWFISDSANKNRLDLLKLLSERISKLGFN